MAEYTKEQLEEMVVGKQPKPRARFFEKAALDVNASKQAGRRIYNPVVYVQLEQSGVTDNISYPAQEADIREYASEYQFFLNNRQGVNRAVSIDIIPNLGIIHRQELVDLGLSSIQKLAAADAVPAHLDYARRSAIILHEALEEQKHGKVTEQEDPLARGPENVHEAHRHDDQNVVRQPELPPSVGRGRDPVAEGREEGGRLDGDHASQKVNWIDNWSLSFTYRP